MRWNNNIYPQVTLLVFTALLVSGCENRTLGGAATGAAVGGGAGALIGSTSDNTVEGLAIGAGAGAIGGALIGNELDEIEEGAERRDRARHHHPDRDGDHHHYSPYDDGYRPHWRHRD